MTTHETKNGIRRGDYVEVYSHNGGIEYVGKRGVVTDIRDAQSPGRLGPYVFEVDVPNDQGGKDVVRAYQVSLIKAQAEVPTEQEHRAQSLLMARVALGDVLPEDLLTAAQWIHDGSLTLTLAGEPVYLESAQTPADVMVDPMAETTKAPQRPDFSTYKTSADHDGDHLAYWRGGGREVVFQIVRTEAGVESEGRATLVNEVNELRQLRDYLTAMIEGE